MATRASGLLSGTHQSALLPAHRHASRRRSGYGKIVPAFWQCPGGMAAAITPPQSPVGMATSRNGIHPGTKLVNPEIRPYTPEPKTEGQATDSCISSIRPQTGKGGKVIARRDTDSSYPTAMFQPEGEDRSPKYRNALATHTASNTTDAPRPHPFEYPPSSSQASHGVVTHSAAVRGPCARYTRSYALQNGHHACFDLLTTTKAAPRCFSWRGCRPDSAGRTEP